MSEESTTLGLVELMRRSLEPVNSRDFDAMMSLFAPDAVWDMSPMGMGTFEGLAAVRGFLEDWIGAYDDYAVEAEEILDLGNGVTFAVNQPERPTCWQHRRRWTALRSRPRMGRRLVCAHHELQRHRRGPCCRRTSCPGAGA
jgi:hypothetical protein